MNILEDDVQEAFYEILENSLFLQKLLYQKELFVKRSILPQFLMRFTHNAFFYTVEHESSDVIIFYFYLMNEYVYGKKKSFF